MPILRTARLRVAVLAGAVALAIGAGIGPAWAPGSLSAQDVLDAVKGAPKLVAEINGALKTGGFAAEKVVCWAARHGNHWTYLGGSRAAPYECTIGARTLTIEARITYYDARGRSLGDIDKADPRQARTFREANFRWTWSP